MTQRLKQNWQCLAVTLVLLAWLAVFGWLYPADGFVVQRGSGWPATSAVTTTTTWAPNNCLQWFIPQDSAAVATGVYVNALGGRNGFVVDGAAAQPIWTNTTGVTGTTVNCVFADGVNDSFSSCTGKFFSTTQPSGFSFGVWRKFSSNRNEYWCGPVTNRTLCYTVSCGLYPTSSKFLIAYWDGETSGPPVPEEDKWQFVCVSVTNGYAWFWGSVEKGPLALTFYYYLQRTFTLNRDISFCRGETSKYCGSGFFRDALLFNRFVPSNEWVVIRDQTAR
jgi:hypothetical protein